MTWGGGDDTRVRIAARDRTTSQGVGGLGAGGNEGPHVRINGHRVLTQMRSTAISRRHNKLSEFREKWFYSVRGGRWILWHWRPREGYVIRALGDGPNPGGHALYEWGLGEEQMAFERRQVGAEKLPAPQLPQETKVLLKLANLTAFVSDVKYADGTPRTPGYFTFRNRTFCYEVTCYDPDAGLRVAVRHNTIDGALAAANELLGVPDAPWEQDDYLTSQLLKKPKKK